MDKRHRGDADAELHRDYEKRKTRTPSRESNKQKSDTFPRDKDVHPATDSGRARPQGTVRVHRLDKTCRQRSDSRNTSLESTEGFSTSASPLSSFRRVIKRTRQSSRNQKGGREFTPGIREDTKKKRQNTSTVPTFLGTKCHPNEVTAQAKLSTNTIVNMIPPAGARQGVMRRQKM